MSYGRLEFDKISKSISDLIVEGATLGKDSWEIASSLELIIMNSLILSETRLAKTYGTDGTFSYLDDMQKYIIKYFKDFDYRS